MATAKKTNSKKSKTNKTMGAKKTKRSNAKRPTKRAAKSKVVSKTI